MERKAQIKQRKRSARAAAGATTPGMPKLPKGWPKEAFADAGSWSVLLWVGLLAIFVAFMWYSFSGAFEPSTKVDVEDDDDGLGIFPHSGSPDPTALFN